MSIGPRVSIIPASAVLDGRIKPRDLQVLCVFGTHADQQGWCRRSQVRMADQLGLSRDTVQRSITRLVAAGYLEVRERTRPDGGTAASEYRVRLDLTDQMARDAAAHPATTARQPDTTDDEGAPPPQESAPPPQKSAPPADSGSAPPADVQIGTQTNDPYLTKIPLKPPYGSEADRDVVAEDEGGFDGERVPAASSLAGDEGDAEHDWRQLEGEWPTAAMDRIGPALALWRTMAAADRRAALVAAGHFVRECRKAGRKVPSVGAYLRERRWERGGLVAAATAAAAGDRVTVPAWSREWWAAWHCAATGAGTRRAAAMAQQAAGGGAYGVPRTDLPSAGGLAEMASVAVGSPEWRAWSGWYHARRVQLPRPERAGRAFFPAPLPPEDAP